VAVEDAIEEDGDLAAGPRLNFTDLGEEGDPSLLDDAVGVWGARGPWKAGEPAINHCKQLKNW
jgi:hypothetical protein